MITISVLTGTPGRPGQLLLEGVGSLLPSKGEDRTSDVHVALHPMFVDEVLTYLEEPRSWDLTVAAEGGWIAASADAVIAHVRFGWRPHGGTSTLKVHVEVSVADGSTGRPPGEPVLVGVLGRA